MRAVGVTHEDVVQYYRRRGFAVNYEVDEVYYWLTYDRNSLESPYHGWKMLRRDGEIVRLKLTKDLQYRSGGGFIDSMEMTPFYLCPSWLAELRDYDEATYYRSLCSMYMGSDFLLGRSEVKLLGNAKPGRKSDQVVEFVVDNDNYTHLLVRSRWNRIVDNYSGSMYDEARGDDDPDIVTCWRLADDYDWVGEDYCIMKLNEDEPDVTVEQCCAVRLEQLQEIVKLSEAEYDVFLANMDEYAKRITELLPKGGSADASITRTQSGYIEVRHDTGYLERYRCDAVGLEKCQIAYGD